MFAKVVGGVLIFLLVQWLVRLWIRNSFLRGGPNPLRECMDAWEALLAVNERWIESVAQKRSRPAGHAKLDTQTGRWLRFSVEGSIDTVVVGLATNDEAVFTFHGGQLSSVGWRGEEYDTCCSDLKGIQNAAKTLLNDTREQCGHHSLGAEYEEPEGEGRVRTDRASVLERRREIAEKRARLGGGAVPKDLRRKDDDEEDEDRPRRRKK